MSGGRTAREYEDFQIQFELQPSLADDGTAGPPRYAVRAEVRGGVVRQPLRLPFDPYDTELVGRVALQLERSVYGLAPRLGDGLEFMAGEGDTGAPTDRAVAVLGAELYRAIFRGDVRRLFDKVGGLVGGLRIRLWLNMQDPTLRSLSRLAWECMKEEPRPDLKYLATLTSTPIVRDVEIGEPLEKPRMEGPLKILIITANPPDTEELGLSDEERVIRETFAELLESGVVAVDELRDASWEDLNDHLNRHDDYDVLHYMGHGEYDEERGGMLLLRGTGNPDADGEVPADRVDGETLQALLREKTSQVRLMFINACNTAVETRGRGDAEGGRARDQREGAVPFAGLATRILETGIPAVLAMQFMIEDDSAIGFARAFYHSITLNQPVDQALSHGRHTELLRKRAEGMNANHWLTPVLYMRAGEDGFLFERSEEGGSAVAEGPAEPTPTPPPDHVDPDAGIGLWFSEAGGLLVLEWSTAGTAREGDIVALYDGPPEDPLEWVGIQYEDAAKSPPLFLTNKRVEYGRYHVAYLRIGERGDYEIAARWGPYLEDRAPTDAATAAE